MVHQKRKKQKRFRAKTTHGYGSMKKNRGAGNKGGKGRAGSGKRGDSKKPIHWKHPDFFGKHGFIKKGRKTETKAINVGFFETNLDKLVGEKLVGKEKDLYVIDLDKLGYNKLLGSGKITKRLKVSSLSSSAHAVEKVKEAGGEVLILNKKNEKNENEETSEKK